MDTLMPTLAFAFVAILIAVMLLGISLLLTGKSKIKPGACGRAPIQPNKRAEQCGQQTACQLCENENCKIESEKENKPTEKEDGV